MNGHELAAIREQYGYTREGLAEILSVEPKAVADWEEDSCPPDEESMRKLTRLYHLRPADLDEPDAALPQFAGKLAAVFPIMVTLLYLMSGFFFNLWGVTWLLFLLIPVFYVSYGMYRMKRPVSLIASYPLMVVVIYLMLGVIFHLWHPAWMMFLTIPIVAAFSQRG